MPISGYGYQQTTEAASRCTTRVSTTLSNLRIVIGSKSGANPVFSLRKNGANGSQTITVTGTGAFEDTVNTDSFNSGDTWNYKAYLSTAGMMKYYNYAVKSASVGRHIGIAGGNPFAGTKYDTLEGYRGPCDNESLTLSKARAAWLAKNLYLNVIANSTSSSSPCGIRKDGADGALKVDIFGLGTGGFEDTVNSVTYSGSETVGWIYRTNGSCDIPVLVFELDQYEPPVTIGAGSGVLVSELLPLLVGV